MRARRAGGLDHHHASQPRAAVRGAGQAPTRWRWRCKLAGRNETAAVSYATEAGLFQAAGAPSVVCGPGDIAQAHTANEWIAR